MANAIGSLFVWLGLDTSAFDSGVDSAKKKLGDLGKFNLGKGISTGLDELGKGFKSSASQAGVLGSALSAIGPAGVLAGAALVGLGAAALKAREAMAFGDEIGDTAAKLGVSTKALQEYRYAVHQLGGEYKDADAALQGFSVAFGTALSKYSAKSVKPFKMLGLDPKAFSDTEDALSAVIDKISKLSSTAEQAAIADKLGLTPILSAVRAGTIQFHGLMDAAERVGFVMDDSIIQKAGEANDRMEDLHQVINVQLNSAFVDLAPAILNVTQALADGARFLSRYAHDMGDFAKDQAQTRKDLATEALGLYLKTPAGQLSAAAGVQGLKALAPQAFVPQPAAGPMDAAADGDVSARGIADALAFGVQTPFSTRRPGHDRPNMLGEGDAAQAAAKAQQVADASAAAIDAAQKAELSARQQITKGAIALAELQTTQVNTETKAANDKLLREAAEGKITAVAAARAITLNDTAASEQRTAIKRQLEDALAQEELEQRQALAGYLDRVAQAEQSLAGSVEQRNAIEAAMLQRRQDLESKELESENARLVRDGQRSKADAEALVSAQKTAQAKETEAQVEQARVAVIEDRAKKDETALGFAIDQLQAASGLAQSDYARAVIGVRILKLQQQLERVQQQKLIDETQPNSDDRKVEEAKMALLLQVQSAQLAAAEQAANIQDAFLEAANDVASLFGDLKRGDLSSAMAALSQSMRGFAGLLGKTGSSLLGQLGTAFGAAGQTFGVAQSLGLGTGHTGANLGVAAAGYLGGMAFSSTLGALAGTGVAELGMTLGGSVAGSLVAGSSVASLVGAAAGPIGMLAALAVSTLFKSKESNHGAIASISGDSYKISGDKRNDQTTQLAGATADTILQAQSALKAAGIKLTTTVDAIDIGTRDATHIMLSNGQKLEAGVGDAAGAAEAALQAMLESATFANDAQKQLVESMLAAGDGFDKISDALGLFSQQLQLPQQIADAIQQLKDPEGYDLTTLSRSQADRRDQVQAAIDAGAIDASQGSAIMAELAELEKLEVQKVRSQYATDAANDNGLQEAQDQLKQAYQAQSQELQATAKQFADIAKSLRTYRDQLTSGAASGLNPLQQTAASRATLEALAAQIPSGDADTLSKLQGAAQDFLSAAKDTAPSAAAYQKDVAWVRKLLDDAAVVADQQVTIAQQRLDQMTATVKELGVVNDSVNNVASAISGLQAAMAATASAGSTKAVNDNAASTLASSAATGAGTNLDDIEKVKGLFTDLQDATSPVYGQRDSVAAMLLDQYRNGQLDPLSGTYNILKAAGFATGGGGQVAAGAGGIDSQLMQFWATPGEFVSVSHQDPWAAVTSLQGQMNNLSGQLTAALEAIAINTRESAKIARQWNGDGMPGVRDYDLPAEDAA